MIMILETWRTVSECKEREQVRYLQNVKLDYKDFDESDNLYDDMDLMQEDCVEAQYWKRNGYLGNPDICALPRPASVEEMKVQNSIPIVGYSRDKVKEMPVYERKRSVVSIKKFRCAFPFHSQVESYLSMALLSSYSSRRHGVSEIERKVWIAGEQSNISILSCTEAVSANVLGFSIVGTSGTGKSTAFDLACRKYPRAIRHNFVEGSYIQIPIMRLTAFTNSNLAALFLSFARQLDRILDTGNDHLSMIQGKTNLGKSAAIICDWVELYHIGAIVIDEIQFLDFSRSAKSFENFLTITANTGAALIAIGTPDACREWSSILRIQRRVASTIVRADSYCKDKAYMETVIKKIWKYQWLNEPADLTQDIVDAMYEESMGSIDLLTSLWMMVQFEALCQKKQPDLDAEFIRKVSKEKFKEMKELLRSELIESESRFLDMRQSLLNDINRSATTDEERHISLELQREAEKNISEHYDRDLILGDIVETVQCCNPEISENRIRKAFVRAEKEPDFKEIPKKERVQRILKIIKKTEPKKKNNAVEKAKPDPERIEMLEDALKAQLA